MSDSVLGAFDLSGRGAIVTGAGGGLGGRFANALADAGATVVCADIDTDGAKETVRTIEARGGSAFALHADVADAASVAEMIRAATAAMPLRVLVNNAGIATRSRRVHETSIEDWDRVMVTNLRGVFLCTRAALPKMMSSGGGSIVNIASVAGLRAMAPDVQALAAYVAAKAGVIGFTKQVAVEYARDGIRANAIAPGFHPGGKLARESGLDDVKKERHFERIRALTPMGRVGRQEELEALLLYLASDASSYVTGQVIAHDGGWTAW